MQLWKSNTSKNKANEGGMEMNTKNAKECTRNAVYICPICEQTFNYKKELYRHLKTGHTDQEAVDAGAIDIK